MAEEKREGKGAWFASLGCMSVPAVVVGGPTLWRTITDPEVTWIWWMFFAGNIVFTALFALVLRRRWWVAAMIFPISTIVLSGFQGLILAGALVWFVCLCLAAWAAWPRKARA